MRALPSRNGRARVGAGHDLDLGQELRIQVEQRKKEHVRYSIDEAPQAFADLQTGKNARGVIDAPRYLALLAKTINGVAATPGRQARRRRVR